jgi:hypothetical protein
MDSIEGPNEMEDSQERVLQEVMAILVIYRIAHLFGHHLRGRVPWS